MTNSYSFRPRKTGRFRVLLLLCLQLIAGGAIIASIAFAQSKEPGYNIFLTNKAENGQPLNQPGSEFDCSDRIYLVVFAAGLSPEPHELKVRWLDPRGTQRELTRYQFEGQPTTKTWAWLQLDGGNAAVIGQMFDPSFGMEEFIGEWKTEVYIDNDQVSEQTFRVLC